MISALWLFAMMPHLASQGIPPSASILESFSVPASDSVAVRELYGIGIFANPASKASVSVDSGVLRAEFTLASDSTEGYTANVGLMLPLSSGGSVVALASDGTSSLKQVRFEYRLSDRIADVMKWTFESELYPSVMKGSEYAASLSGSTALSASLDWKAGRFDYADFGGPSWFTGPPAGFVTFDSILTRATALRIEPTTLYSASGSQFGTVCNKCVDPTMKHLVLELRRIRIDRVGLDGDSTPLVLGLPRTQVGTSRRIAPSLADIFWQHGELRIADPSRWVSAGLVRLDGGMVRELPVRSSQKVELPATACRVVLFGRDGGTASLPVVGIR